MVIELNIYIHPFHRTPRRRKQGLSFDAQINAPSYAIFPNLFGFPLWLRLLFTLSIMNMMTREYG